MQMVKIALFPEGGKIPDMYRLKKKNNCIISKENKYKGCKYYDSQNAQNYTKANITMT